MALCRNQILLLLFDESELPSWFPVALFQAKDARLPADWTFGAFQAHEDEVEAIWGYSRLVDGSAHWAALLERDPDVLKTLFQER